MSEKWFSTRDFLLDSALFQSNQEMTWKGCYTMQEIANIFKYPNQILEIIFTGLLVAFPISENLLAYISVWNSLIKQNVLFLKEIVMGNEKWILYNKVEYKKLWGKQNRPPLSTVSMSKTVPFQTIQFSISTQFNCRKHFYFKLLSLVKRF